MDCPKCGHKMVRGMKYATVNRGKRQQWRCLNCGKTKVIAAVIEPTIPKMKNKNGG